MHIPVYLGTGICVLLCGTYTHQKYAEHEASEFKVLADSLSGKGIFWVFT